MKIIPINADMVRLEMEDGKRIIISDDRGHGIGLSADNGFLLSISTLLENWKEGIRIEGRKFRLMEREG